MSLSGLNIYGGMGPLGVSRASGVTPWWLAGGISASACVAAYQPKGAASYAASKVNLANPGTYDASEGVQPGWDVTNGWKFSAANAQYLITMVSIVSTYTIICRFSEAGAGVLFGAALTGDYYGIFPNTGGKVYYYNRNEMSKAPGMTAGVLAIAGTSGYRDGSADVTTLNGLATTPRAVLIARFGGAFGYYLTGYIQAFAIYNATLSATQVAALTTAMNAL